MQLVYGHPTRLGPVFIGLDANGRWHPIWKGDSLGSYINAVQAIDDVAGGHTFSPSDGVDTSTLGISSDIGDWLPAKSLM